MKYNEENLFPYRKTDLGTVILPQFLVRIIPQ